MFFAVETGLTPCRDKAPLIPPRALPPPAFLYRPQEERRGLFFYIGCCAGKYANARERNGGTLPFFYNR